MVVKRRWRNFKITKQEHFFGKKNIARIFFKKSRSNFYITLTDLKFKVIMCYSAGSVVLGTRRKILSKFSIDTVLNKMLPYFNLYKIKSFDIIVKSMSAGHIYTLANFLSAQGYFIISIKDRVPVAHNGIRGQKIPRK